ncbi:MAG: methyltransferase, partial [Bacilli bacterium]
MNHYFTNEILPSDIKKITVIINNKKYNFLTDNGVFSKSGLDFGTRTLLETIEINNIKGNVLD